MLPEIFITKGCPPLWFLLLWFSVRHSLKNSSECKFPYLFLLPISAIHWKATTSSFHFTLLAAVREDEGSLKITQKGGEKAAIYYQMGSNNYRPRKSDGCARLLAVLWFRLAEEQQAFLPWHEPAIWKPRAHVQGSEGILKNISKKYEQDIRAELKTSVLSLLLIGSQLLYPVNIATGRSPVWSLCCTPGDPLLEQRCLSGVKSPSLPKAERSLTRDRFAELILWNITSPCSYSILL